MIELISPVQGRMGLQATANVKLELI